MKTRDPVVEALRAAFEEDAKEEAGDEALLARAIDGAMRATASPTSVDEGAPSPAQPTVANDVLAERTSPTSVPAAVSSSERLAVLSTRRGGARVVRRRAVRYGLPLAAAFAASLAMAALYVRSQGVEPSSAPPRLEPAPLPAPAKESTPSTPAATPDQAPTLSVDDLPSAPATPTPTTIARRPTGGPSAAELFRDANQARRAGDAARAVEVYRALVTSHAATPEAHAARVSLGRLLLDQRGDAAGALVHFDAYLASSVADRALAEEARLGRALVFQRQGLQERERRAWQELLEKHPDSLHAGRARARLAALPSSPPSSPQP